MKNRNRIRTVPAAWLLPLVLLLTPPVTVQAQFTFKTNNGALTITGYTGPGGDVTTPSTTNGLPVTSIGSNAFNNVSSITNITILNGVTNIGDSAFQNCTNLIGIIIPIGVTTIGNSAFSSCHALTNVPIPNSVNKIGSAAFRYCASLSSVIISSNVTSIGGSVFSSCTALASITVDPLNSVYSSLDGVMFDKGMTSLLQCPGGKAGSYTIPQGISGIAGTAFSSCTSLTNITIPNSVTNVGSGAFEFCSTLTGITIPNGATSIGVATFYKCTSLSNVAIPDSVTNIGDMAFSECRSLSSVTIPTNITTIGVNAFYGCTNLTDVIIPRSVTSIASLAFAACTGLASIIVDSLNPVYSSLDGVLFNKAMTILMQCPGGKAGNYTIPITVTFIESSAFSYCLSLTNVTIPANVTSIGISPFVNCTNLTSVFFKGDAPGVSILFSGKSIATIYYLPGKVGWTATYGIRPTALWLPQALTADSNFGIRTNQFGFNLFWASGMTVAVDACTNLTNPTWTPLQTNTLTTDTHYFSDPQWMNYPTRFYRLRWAAQ